MYISPTYLSIASSVAVVALAKPLLQSTTLAARDNPKPSAYPYGDAATNEFKWLNWDPKNDADKRDGQIIHQAFIDWKDLVKQGAVAADNKDGATFKRWFGKQQKPEEIKQVFGKMWDGSDTNKPVADIVCNRKDFINGCKGKRAAYMIPDSGVFHVCQYSLDRPQLSKIQCNDLEDSCSIKMRSLSMTLLHEMTHYSKIGADARGSMAITDEAAGAYDCFKLDHVDKPDNAQNYAWLAGEAYFSEKCSKTFKDPKKGVAATAKDEEYVEGSTLLNADTSKPLPGPICPGTATTPPAIKFRHREATKAIKTFCSNRKYWGQVIVPAVSFGTGLTSDGRHKALSFSDKFPVNGDNDHLWLGLSFSEDECSGMFQFDVGKDDKESLAHCVNRFEAILSGCHDHPPGKRLGGEFRDVCAVYEMTAEKIGSSNPTILKSAIDPGTFTCKNFDTSAIGGSSSFLANTCQCHYSNVPGPTDIFKKPKDGNCAKASKTDLVTN